MTKLTNTAILGTPKAGYANTVPMIGSNGKYGVYDVTKDRFVDNTPWDFDADKVIELFDDMTMARLNGKKFKKPKTIKVAATKPAIVRERNGDKAAVAKKIFEQYPGMKTAKLIAYCQAELPEVSAANFRFLLDKCAGKR